MKIREPAVAGTFYPRTQEKIFKLISEIDAVEKGKYDRSLAGKKIIGGIIPHAGYIYSGYESVHLFNLLSSAKERIDTVIIFNPDHRGMGPGFAADSNDIWKTPVGNFMIDQDLLAGIDFPRDPAGHKFEHSAEVMLPFIRYYLPYEVKILPVSIQRQTPGEARIIAQKVIQAIQKTGKKVFVIASSDFSHFVEPEIGFKLDSEIIESIIGGDIDILYRKILDKKITVCGYGPIMILMEISRNLFNNVKVRVLSRGNSGKAGRTENVVDYVSMLFYLEE